MNQFKNILLIAPVNSQVLSHATELMSSSQSKITLMSVVPELDLPNVKTERGEVIDLQKLLAAEAQADLDKTAASLKDEDFRIKTVVTSDNHAFISIIEQVQSKKHDLVMMLADGVSSVREQLFGTLSMHLMRKCPCAVWVVKPSRRRKLRNVVAAVDPDPDDPTRDQLNIEILKRAASVAQHNGSQLHVVHAWDAMGGEVTRSRRWMSKQEIRLYVESISSEHRSQLNELLKKHSDGTEIVHMLQGRSGDVISKLVANMSADLLVMGTVCRTGIPGFFIGNTAETILNQVDCSVLTVKPKGFVSPVTAS